MSDCKFCDYENKKLCHGCAIATSKAMLTELAVQLRSLSLAEWLAPAINQLHRAGVLSEQEATQLALSYGYCARWGRHYAALLDKALCTDTAEMMQRAIDGSEQDE